MCLLHVRRGSRLPQPGRPKRLPQIALDVEALVVNTLYLLHPPRRPQLTKIMSEFAVAHPFALQVSSVEEYRKRKVALISGAKQLFLEASCLSCACVDRRCLQGLLARTAHICSFPPSSCAAVCSFNHTEQNYCLRKAMKSTGSFDALRASILAVCITSTRISMNVRGFEMSLSFGKKWHCEETTAELPSRIHDLFYRI